VDFVIRSLLRGGGGGAIPTCTEFEDEGSALYECRQNNLAAGVMTSSASLLYSYLLVWEQLRARVGGNGKIT
jgi:hypothetical protein